MDWNNKIWKWVFENIVIVPILEIESINYDSNHDDLSLIIHIMIFDIPLFFI